MSLRPNYDLRACAPHEIKHLFERHHAYKGTGNTAVYSFAVFEDAVPVAAFLWQPPPPGAAKSTCVELPHGVLALSRMVAVPRDERALNHISKPLRRQMNQLIDRTRWPVLVTYSDESVGHTGHVYKCSGWQATIRRKNKTFTSSDGRRVSDYSNGVHANHASDVVMGGAWMQRWEHWVATKREVFVDETTGEENEVVVGDRDAVVRLFAEHWDRVPVVGKSWRSGKQAYTYVPREDVSDLAQAHR